MRKAKTYPEMNAKIADLLKMGDNYTDQYAAQYIEELQAEAERLHERLHKADGMANEINVLAKENRKLQAEVERQRYDIGQLIQQVSEGDWSRISVANARKDEREHCLKAVATVRSYYPVDVFLPEGKTVDARSAAFARRLCDGIRDAICAVDFENGRNT
jgi:hypothetical protein